MLTHASRLFTAIIFGLWAFTINPQPAHAAALPCGPDTAYALRDNGEVHRIDYAAGFHDGGKAFAFEESGFQANGLAITDAGVTAYALGRTSPDRITDTAVEIQRWDARGAKKVASYTYPEQLRVGTIGGAAHPGRDEGYFFGGFGKEEVSEFKEEDHGRWVAGFDYSGRFHSRLLPEGNWEHWVPDIREVAEAGASREVFRLFRYSSGEVTYLGFVVLPQASPSPFPVVANGDIAFNEAGDLAILYHATDGDLMDEVAVITVAAEDVRGARGARIPAAKTSLHPIELASLGEQINGLAFRPDGRAVIEVGGQPDPFSGEVLAGYYLWNPSSNEVSYPEELESLSSVTDMASCSGFPTITLEKELSERAQQHDQFQLSIAQGKNQLATARTAGEESGRQKEKAGPVPAVAGTTYRLSEALSSSLASRGSGEGDYRATISCRSGNQEVPVRGTESGWELDAPVGSVACTILNEPQRGDLAWRKTDTEGALLPGSTWELRSGTTTLRVEDCTGTCEGTDKNPAPGEFLVTGLPFGQYELKELVAPEGFAPGEPIRFTHDAAGTPAGVRVLGDIHNRRGAALSWEKVNPAGEKLGGSAWQLEGPTRQEVSDCTAAPCQGADVDPEPGAFRVENLAPGVYQLRETHAPAGYQLAEEEHRIDLTKESHVVAGSFVNELGKGFELPRTGGKGPGALLAGGWGTLTIAALAAMARRFRLFTHNPR